MNAIVISVGGLNANTLGCYGGQRVETPALDRFAAVGFVFDQCYVECPSPNVTRRNWWSGCFQYPPDPSIPPDTPPDLLSALRAHGVRAVLIRDTSRGHGANPQCTGFDQVFEIEREDWDTTKQLLDTAKDWIEQESKNHPFLLFIDCHGAHRPWLTDPDDDDLTVEESDQSSPALDAGEDEEQEIEFDESEQVDQANDRDETHPSPRADEDEAYLTAACRIDYRIGEFLQWFESTQNWDRTLLMITSDAAGPAQTEPRPVDLREYQTHLPLLVRYPGFEPGGRSSALVQPVDLIPTVLDAVGATSPNAIHGRTLLPVCRLETYSMRPCLWLLSPDHERAIRTMDWYMVQRLRTQDPADAPASQLFIKPDDRWERDDVATQYLEVIDELGKLVAVRCVQ